MCCWCASVCLTAGCTQRWYNSPKLQLKSSGQIFKWRAQLYCSQVLTVVEKSTQTQENQWLERVKWEWQGRVGDEFEWVELPRADVLLMFACLFLLRIVLNDSISLKYICLFCLTTTVIIIIMTPVVWLSECAPSTQESQPVEEWQREMGRIPVTLWNK